MSHKEFRKFLNQCDKRGMLFGIKRNGPKSFDVLFNFEIVRQYKNRVSCKNKIMKMYALKLREEAA